MAVQEFFPLLAIDPVANAHNAWVALRIRCMPGEAPAHLLQAVADDAGLLEAAMPLGCLLVLEDLEVLPPALLARLPAHRVGFIVPAALAGSWHVRNLREAGYRVLCDTPAVPLPEVGGQSWALDCSEQAPCHLLEAAYGPHLAYGVDSVERRDLCARQGVAWFAGDYGYDPEAAPAPDEASGSRRRIMTLLALLARDADSYELEQQIRQDPTLAYHLLRLVNSAAFAVPTEITSFGQAITVLGRRQLQRWLQLLLYARQQPEGPPNLLLPLAARRGIQLEALCRAHGGDHDAQDQAYMAGVFSLLDRLLRMPLSDVTASLCLPQEVSGALLHREGRLGTWLRLCEAHPSRADLAQAGVSVEEWFSSQLQAYRWAIQVGRNV